MAWRSAASAATQSEEQSGRAERIEDLRGLGEMDW